MTRPATWKPPGTPPARARRSSAGRSNGSSGAWSRLPLPTVSASSTSASGMSRRPEVVRRQMAECIVEQRRGVRHRGIAFHRAGGAEAGEGERLDKGLQRHAVLQSQADGDREIVHQAAERRAFLVQGDEHLAQRAVIVFAGAQVQPVAADRGLLRVAGPPWPAARGAGRHATAGAPVRAAPAWQWTNGATASCIAACAAALGMRQRIAAGEQLRQAPPRR